MAKKKVPARHINRVVDLVEPQIVAALREGKGVIKTAAQILKCDRTELSRRINSDDKLFEVRKEAFDTLVDEVEETYFDKMLKTGDKVMMIFFLKCHGKERGWVERQEITGADGEPLGQVVAPVRQVNAEDWAKENLKVVG